VGIVGAIVIAFGWSVTSSQQLRIAREDLARAAAVNEERLRIARDLHDLLGHNLSLIALKSELARRLVGVTPDRAAAEIRDIELVARQALQEVREAVASYRQPTLASELQGAREMLAVAGIAYRYEGAEDAISALPSAVESVLAWAVREGVTNVIRHGHARQCTVRLARADGTIRVEVIDDGIGTAVPAVDEAVAIGVVGVGVGGSGLRGLAERVTALGGRCESGAVEGGGFRLMVIAPLTQAASGAQFASTANNAGDQNTIGASQA
jgi:two-component system, NarL family, sensor histidine kinase DesK